jgi:type IV secretory pathway VirB6-like protein
MALGYFAMATQATTQLVASYGGTFLADGVAMFRSIAVVRVVWEGFKIGFRSQPANKLAELLVGIAITYCALVYYNAPFPGVGKGLTEIVTSAGADLAQTIDSANENNIGTALANAMGQSSGSSWGTLINGAAMVRYFVLEAVLSVMQAAILGVIAAGFIIAGIMVLVGPIFIPFLIVPHFEHFALNWFRCLVQYSFYPVVGNAVVFVSAQIWLNYFSQFTFPMDSQTLAAALTVIVTTAFGGVYVIFKVPLVVSHLFSGSSGLGGWR